MSKVSDALEILPSLLPAGTSQYPPAVYNAQNKKTKVLSKIQ